MLHTLQTESVACRLAAHWGQDVQLASRAALLHDCAKGLPLSKMQSLAQEGGLLIDRMTWDSRALLHAHIGAYLARRDYGEQDKAVLAAIQWHTTGRPHMTPLEEIVYLADMIEPGRRMFDALPQIREQVFLDLHEAMRIALGSTVAYIKWKHNPIHPMTLETLQWLEDAPGAMEE